MSKLHLKVKSIKNGTVIDHITANRALNVLSILNLPDGETPIMLGINVESSDMGRKDIVKIEDRELSEDEVDKLVLIAPQATVNIIRDYEIVSKSQLKLMDEIDGVIDCSNPNCISNSNEPIESRFYVVNKKPVILRCHYCERSMDYDDIESQFQGWLLELIHEVLSLKSSCKTDVIDITSMLEDVVKRHEVSDGLLNVYTTHTTSSIVINENESGLVEDIKALFSVIARDSLDYMHNRIDGNATSHLRSVLTPTSECIPVVDSRLALGTWQSVFFVDFDGPRSNRRIIVSLLE